MRRVALECAQPSFIGCWNLDDPRLCQAIIEHFERHPVRHVTGRSTYGVDPSMKNSVDYTVHPKELKLPSHAILDEYMQGLHDCYRDYLLQWPFLDRVVHDLDIAFRIWGFLGDAPQELIALRKPLFEACGHHYSDQRAIVDHVPEATLRLTHGEVAARFPSQWRDLLGLS